VELSKVLKGLYAAALAFLSSLAAILQGPASFSAVTAGQWVTVSALTLAAFGGTFGLAGWAGPRINGGSSGGK
jgi:hypothetical protein